MKKRFFFKRPVISNAIIQAAHISSYVNMDAFSISVQFVTKCVLYQIHICSTYLTLWVSSVTFKKNGNLNYAYIVLFILNYCL